MISRVYCRHYTDNDQKTFYVEWSNGSRTECPADRAWTNLHFGSLLKRAEREGVKIEAETW